MAYVRARGKRRKQYLRFRDETGEWKEMVSTARTKTEAQRIAEELERKAERIRLGLELPPPPSTRFEDLGDRWLREILPGLRGKKPAESRMRKHLIPGFTGKLITEITPALVEAFLAEKDRDLGETSVEHLRRQLRAVLNVANEVWELFPAGWKNPAAAARARKLRRRPTQWLEAHEIAPTLARTPIRWRPFFTCAVYTGMRKGEVAGLRWKDVDFERRLVRVAYSYDVPFPKDDETRYIPICDELLVVLKEQFQKRKGTLVFPRPDGKMVQPWERPEIVLRRALKNAGIVEHYIMVCRRKGCGYQDKRFELVEARCPKCDFKLWPKAIPKPLVFHDTRSTFATHLRERTGDIELVQKFLGHSTPAITAAIYSGVRDEYGLAGVNRLKFQPAPAQPNPAAPEEKDGASLGQKRRLPIKFRRGRF
jgi:integrase